MQFVYGIYIQYCSILVLNYFFFVHKQVKPEKKATFLHWIRPLGLSTKSIE
jgi:hypothetical protein